jgi:hypothetical protein
LARITKIFNEIEITEIFTFIAEVACGPLRGHDFEPYEIRLRLDRNIRFVETIQFNRNIQFGRINRNIHFDNNNKSIRFDGNNENIHCDQNIQICNLIETMIKLNSRKIPKNQIRSK